MRHLGLILWLIMSLCPTLAFGQSDSLAKESVQKTQNKYTVTAAVHTLTSYSVGAGRFLQISKRWSFEPGLFWEYRDETFDSGLGGDYCHFHHRTHFITAPLLFRKRMSKLKRENFVSYFHIGPYLAYGMFGKTDSHHEHYNFKYEQQIHLFQVKPELFDYKVPKETIVMDENSDTFGSNGVLKNRWDYGLDVGFSFLICKHFEIGTFLEFGTSEERRYRGEDHPSSARYWHKGIGLSLGYQF